MKEWKTVLQGILAYCLVLSLIWVVIPVSADAAVYDRVIRLHVLADSDEKEAQALKLEVRDEVLRLGEKLMENCGSREEALTLLSRYRENIEEYLDEFLAGKGVDYRCRVKLSREHYNTREYEDFRLPAGEYLSLQVILGKGEGKNWWCVLFPPVCLSCAQAEEELISSGMEKDSVKVFTVDSGQYRFRFRLLELLGSWFG